MEKTIKGEKKADMDKDISFKVNEKLKPEEVSQLYIASGMNRPVEDLDKIQRMIEHADLTITAWNKEQSIGIARAITDYSFCCFLADLAVDQYFQGMGIGKNLVRILKEQIGKKVSLILLSSPIAMDFYPRIGFEKVDNCFAIKKQDRTLLKHPFICFG
jgi:ribosomal protein S18 acetylase RimI-like enzyme